MQDVYHLPVQSKMARIILRLVSCESDGKQSTPSTQSLEACPILLNYYKEWNHIITPETLY